MEKAAKLFKQAGCVQSDIKAALTSHIKHDEIDIPQDEPEEAKKVSSPPPPPFPFPKFPVVVTQLKALPPPPLFQISNCYSTTAED